MDMQSPISLVIMTANGWRHRFFVNYLSERFNLLGVVIEEKRPLPQGDTEKEDELIKGHFGLREKKEIEYFGKHTNINVDSERILSVQHGESNTERVFQWVKNLNPDYLILFGTSIIKDPLLSYYHNRIINMHLGLSPYYRGAGTNFWPLVNNEPECVGATVHLATLEVDAGAILGQARPEIQIGDGSHDIGNKTIIAGARMMAQCIKAYHTGRIKPKVQGSEGKVYKNKDFNAQAISTMLDNFQNGMIENFLLEKERRYANFPIIDET